MTIFVAAQSMLPSKANPSHVLTLIFNAFYESKTMHSMDPNVPEDMEGYNLLGRLKKMASAWRVFSFFMLVFVLPTILISIPLYARYHMYPGRSFGVVETDSVSLDQWASSFWCQGQQVSSNGTLNAFLIEGQPHLRKKRVPVTFQQASRLEHDDMEFWSFFLLSGSRLRLSACARLPGATLVLVQGKRQLDRCMYKETAFGQSQPNAISRPSPKLVVKALSDGEENLNDEILEAPLDLGVLDYGDPLLNADTRQNEVSSKEDLINRAVKKLKKERTRSREKRSDVRYSYKKTYQFLQYHNETVYSGNSSYSSSEEFLENCHGLLPFHEISFNENCSLNLNSDSDWEVKVNESDHYFVILTSDNSKEYNLIDFKLYILRSVYDLSSYSSNCTNSLHCQFPFSFLKSESVVVNVGEHDVHPANYSSIPSYEMTVVCEPRIAVYMVFILLVPFVIILFAFQ